MRYQPPDGGLIDKVIGIGNYSGADTDSKFEKFKLTPEQTAKVKVPLVQGAPDPRVLQVESDELVAAVVPKMYPSNMWYFQTKAMVSSEGKRDCKCRNYPAVFE